MKHVYTRIDIPPHHTNFDDDLFLEIINSCDGISDIEKRCLLAGLPTLNDSEINLLLFSLNIKSHRPPLLHPERHLHADMFSKNESNHIALQGESIPPHPHITFDEKRFLRLLSRFESLTTIEKRRIIREIPLFTQYQIDKIISVMDRE